MLADKPLRGLPQFCSLIVRVSLKKVQILSIEMLKAKGVNLSQSKALF